MRGESEVICANVTLVSILVFTAVTGCSAEPFHKKVGWRATDYFMDEKVVALCEAIQADDLEMMRDAVARGADVNAVGKEGMTPLLWAFPDHKVDRFRWLLENGADPNVCISGPLGSGGVTFEKGKSVTYLAFETKWDEHYKLVLQHGGNPHLQCEKQREPLVHIATRRIPRLKAILQAGADVDARDRIGRTPLMRCASVGGATRALVLLQHGADPFLYQEGRVRQAAHFLIQDEHNLPINNEANRQAYKELCRVLEARGVDFEAARQDIERWKSWGNDIITIRELEKKEVEARLAEQAKLEQQPRDAAP